MGFVVLLFVLFDIGGHSQVWFTYTVYFYFALYLVYFAFTFLYC